MEENSGDSQNLHQRVCLAKNARTELSAADRRIKNRSHYEDSDIPAKNEDGHSGGDKSFVRKHQKQSAQKKLVRHWVKVVAQHGSLLEDACEGAVECIGKASDYEESKAEGISVLKNSRNQKWGEADSEQSEDIGRGPKRIQARGRFFRLERHCRHLAKPLRRIQGKWNQN